MKQCSLALLSAAALLVFSTSAFATQIRPRQSSATVDVKSVAAPVRLVPNHIANLTDEEILGAASRVVGPGHALHSLVPTITAEGEIGSPETEGPDTGGPGGPDHQFEGQETGEH